ncbi:hypothetical protein YDYSY3_39390 [Paenibacillus chitinolyticus]|uniref:TIGR02391 family protein n=1 Tax=Paenibacillus chitinolyticus TaxID=79263 RepID=UPI0026E4B458|nr:TIGR02391 family protein [Paenibacillus chitinolyticus]GKS12939.1 hypothetical protein YDYSY3_39390 [Paenibacillus chitinolyticus]
MTSKINCPLCGNEAVQMSDRLDVYLINCPSCGDFRITPSCLEDLPAERKLQSQLAKVSAFTRYRTINKEPIATLFIGTPEFPEGFSIQQIVHQFPTVPERKLKALQNLKGLSKYWGDAVLIDRKDFSIFYPEVNEEQPSLMMMRTLVEEALVSGEVKFPTTLTVTEKGDSLLSDQAAPVVPVATINELSTPAVVQPSKLEGLHPRVLGVAQKLFQDGHFRSAVLETFVTLDNDVRRKSGLDENGTALMQKAFTNKAPILKVKGGDDAQQGAMWLFSGSVMGVRNILAHDHSIHPSEQEALELLYFASLLFGRLDQAVNINTERLIAEISQLSFKLDGKNSSSCSSKLKEYLAPSRKLDDGELHRICFRKILEIIKSSYFNDQSTGIDLLLEWDATIFDHITLDDHIDLIFAIYSATHGYYPSYSAQNLVRDGFRPITKSFELFQENMLSNTEVFRRMFKKISYKDNFFRMITHYSDLEFMVAFLNKVVDKDILLRRNELDDLSCELNRAEREGLEVLTHKITKMSNELNK